MRPTDSGIDISTRFYHPFHNDIAAPDRFRHVLGPCGPRPTGVAEKRFLINNNSPMMWLSLHQGPKLDRKFHTVVQGLWPYAMEPVGENRLVWVGASWGTIRRKVLDEAGKTATKKEPNPGLAVAKNAMFEKQQGKKDGYFLLMEFSSPKR
jgi:hypothetical protein